MAISILKINRLKCNKSVNLLYLYTIQKVSNLLLLRNYSENDEQQLLK